MSDDTPIVAARIEGIGMVSAHTRPDWRAAPRANARLTIRVLTDRGEHGSCLWFVDGRIGERQGLDDDRWATIAEEICKLLLERAAGKVLYRIRSGTGPVD